MLDPPKNCPHCGAPWFGDETSDGAEDISRSGRGTIRAIAIIASDGDVAWMCPDCGWREPARRGEPD